jgi:hypothetical protein
MSETERFTIGADASCSDGPCGKLRWVVVDPVARAVTHIVVEPHFHQGFERLVPVDLVAVTGDGISIGCSVADFEKLEPAEKTEFLTGVGAAGGFGDYVPGQVLSWPYYGLGATSFGRLDGGGLAGTDLPLAATYESVPLGEVAVHRGDHVHATDGAIGRVQGLVIEPGNHHVTHVLLQEGHLWGRKAVAIPISAVTSVDDGIHLNITKQAVDELPPIDLHGTDG